MARHFYPDIAAEDYELFRGIVADLPDTHDEWLEELRKAQNRDLDQDRDPDVVIARVSFTPAEFAGESSDLTVRGLYTFAEQKRHE